MRSRDPRVSVVVATYRRPEYLRLTLQAIAGQTFRDFEVLVVSDGASDEDAAVVASLGDDRFSWDACTHAGRPAPARNVGIARSRGEYVAFCDDDDLWEPEKLARQIARLEAETDAVLSHTSARQIDRDGRDMGPHKPTWMSSRLTMSPISYNQRPDRAFLKLPFFHVLHSSVVVRRAAVEQCGAFDEHELLAGREDTEFVIRVAARTRRPFAFVPEPLVGYRYDAHSLGRSASYPRPERQDYFHRVLLERGTLTPDQHRRFVANQYAVLALNALRQERQPTRARIFARQSWSWRPGVINSVLVAVAAGWTLVAPSESA